ncbi:glucose-6-phosphate dehydrogenase [Fimicolochytrium jonesii]|uniref:glucose-6-phosphate dehydrogenase n=1 Tax=Fimicolochytrium jonesii TaxID=1396493 RepID=UPI0022FEE151|nr:glucose-6-phosphate dehydrogenase [Fimicolochytrium jonesii]KAI8824377.1 glucose-6-phosphate dehydrogenase [Fimicolochytrium jonesii]
MPGQTADQSGSQFDHVSIIVFGASGDLAKKMTYPAIYSLVKNGRLQKDKLHVVGTARSEYKIEDFRKKIQPGISKKDKSESESKDFLEICSYVQLKGYDDAESYKKLNDELNKLERGSGKHLRLFYIALPPSAFEDVAANVRTAAWAEGKTNRIIIEKPYGKDYKSAKTLSSHLEKLYKEEELYRIDHYLGKDAVKCVLPLRFGANPILANSWSREHIKYVTINFKEEFGAEGRGGYFDEFGMIRDVMQNHLMQWIILSGMEKPKSLSTNDIHIAKLNFIKACRPIRPEDTLVGQYGASSKDKDKKAYVDDDTVKDDSKANTFATAVLFVDTERWKDVPFVIRAGKALDETRAEITFVFKSDKDALFPTKAPTSFTIREHPHRSHTLTLYTKQSGSGFRVVSAPLAVDMVDTELGTADKYQPSAYESLIYDAVQGDQTWFIPREEAEEGWKIWDDAIKGTENRTPFKYEYGSEGPKEEKEFLEKWGVRFGTQETSVADVTKLFSAAKI